MKRRILVSVALILLLVLAVPAAGFYWLCFTQQGLEWAIAQTKRMKNVRIEATGLKGSLSGPLSAEYIVIEHERARIEAHDIWADVRLRSLLLQTVHIKRLRVAHANVMLKPRIKPPKPRKPRFMPAWLQLRVNRINAGPARLTLLNGQTIETRATRGKLSVDNRHLRLRNLTVTAEEFACAGVSELIAADPYGLNGQLRCAVQLPGQPRYAANFELKGDLKRLNFVGQTSAPFVANFQGAALDLTEAWRWQAQATAVAMNLKPWSPESGLGNFAFSVNAQGARDTLRAQGRIIPVTFPTGPMEFAVNGAFADKRLRADRLELRLTTNRTRIVSHGEIIFDGGPPTLALQGNWTQFSWPVQNKASAFVSPQGVFTLTGPLPYAYTASADLTLPQAEQTVPPLKVVARGSFDKTWLYIDQVEVKPQATQLRGITPGMVLTGQGQLSFAKTQDWRLALKARHIDPAYFNEALPGDLNFELTASGTGFEPEGPWQARLTQLGGRLRAQPLKGQAGVSRDHKQWQITNTELRLGDTLLRVNGSYDDTPDVQWLLSTPNLAQLLPDARGSIDFSGRLSGSAAQPELSGRLNATGLRYGDYAVASVQGTADMDFTQTQNNGKSSGQNMQLQLAATELTLGARKLNTLRISLKGKTNAHTLNVDADAGNARMTLAAQGAYTPRQWQGTVTALIFNGGEAALTLNAPIPVLASAERIEVGQFCLTGTPEKVCGQGRWQANGRWNAELTAQALPLRLFALGLPREAQYSGSLNVEARGQGEPAQAWTGTARLDVNQGVFFYKRADGEREQLSLGSGNATLTAEAGRFVLTAKLNAGETAQLEATANARREGTDWKAFPLSGGVQARTRELGFLPILVPEIDRAAGEMDARFDLSGVLGAPRFEGRLGLKQGELDLYAANLLLRDITANVQLGGNSLALDGQLRAGEGTAQIAGKLSWTGGVPQGTLDFKGENLVVANVPEARVHASPNISVSIEGRKIGVDGAVRVPYARLAPANLTGAVLPSEDEIIVGTEPEDPNKRFLVTTGIHLILGKDVRIDSYGLSGKLTGGIVLYTATDEVSTGTGELKVEEGKYTAYGRELDIERGRLVFTGGVLSNPGVDIRATKKIAQILAGVNVRGALRDPRVTFFSEPPLPQTQIASLLVAGRTFDSFQDGTSTNSAQTRDQLLAEGGALLARQLGTQLGIDEVSVESGATATDSTSLVLGKYLSPRLYVGYGISLAEAINTFKLRYTLGDRWTIKLEAGENRSADVVYAIDR